jgi:hypothetical protein
MALRGKYFVGASPAGLRLVNANETEFAAWHGVGACSGGERNDASVNDRGVPP